MPEKEVPHLSHPRLRETDNGPKISYEGDLLRQYFGEPDEDGVYGAVKRDA